MDRKEIEKIVSGIEKKLKNKKVRDKFEFHRIAIQKLLGRDVDITINFGDTLEQNFTDDMNIKSLSSELSFNETISENGITLGQFIKILKEEPEDVIVTIDPVLLPKKEGVNLIKDVLTVVVNNEIIIVPKVEE